MAKGRRDQFEDQLRDLQKDISSLSQKLSIPSIGPSVVRYGGKDEGRVEGFDATQDVNRSFASASSRIHVSTEKGDKYAQLMQEAHIARKEKDDAVYRLEQAKLEIEDMRRSLQDTVRLKTAYEHLKQDYESVKVSLESSERIRKQQKELINLLQRSHSIAVASDSGSIMSLNSISSIEHVGTQPSSSSRKAMDLSSASLAAENREWLYKSMDMAANGTKQPSVPQVVGDNTGVQKTRRKSRSEAVTGLPPRPSMSTNPGYTVSAPKTDAAEQRRASNSANNSTNNSTITGASSTKGTRKSSKHTSSGSKSRRKSTKVSTPEIIPTHLLGNLSEGVPSYQNIIGMNTSLVPGLNTSTVTSGILNNRSFGSTGYAGTDVGPYSVPVRSPADLNTSNMSLNSQHSRYSHTGDFAPSLASPGLSTLPHHPGGAGSAHYPEYSAPSSAQLSAQPVGRPPRHPAGSVTPSVPAGAVGGKTRHITATIPSVHPDTHGYVPPAGYSLVPEAPTNTGATPRRPATSAGARTSTSAGKSARKSRAYSRRMPQTPGSAAAGGSSAVAPRTATSRSQSAPPVRHVSPAAGRPAGVSTFGNASRNL